MSTATAVRERPILFSAPMVRAILEGRKTQTRRVVTVPRRHQLTMTRAYTADRWSVFPHPGGGFMAVDVPDADPSEYAAIDPHGFACPHGAVGDRLWVRETFAVYGEFRNGPGYCYRADGDLCGVMWKPSIFMSRAVSRITLEITSVRVERLQGITEADAVAEGVEPQKWVDFAHPLRPTRNMGGGWMPCTHVEAYQHLWDGINAARGYSWGSNPWVWVIEFRRIEQP